MNFLAELWREVGRHQEMEESVRRIVPMLAARWPIESLVVRRLDREPMRLTTVASVSSTAGDALESASTRTECEEPGARELLAFLSGGKPVLLREREGSQLGRCVLPAGIRTAVIALPLTAEDRPLGVALIVAGPGETLRTEHVEAAQELTEPLAVAFENDQRLHELARMREALEADRRALLSRLERQDITETIVGESAGLRSVMERVEQVAPTDAPVLILGETGSGKEVIARSIHARSRRARGPVVRVNCGAIPANLIDSELFGHERGSFTGAVSTRKGWFERADGGTLFLDELGELPLEAQVRLLRVLQDGSLERVGGHQAITVDVRIVAATHRNLETMVAAGRFREDLWYRISIFPVRLPGLRERPQDIPALATHFAQRAGLRLSGTALTPSEHDVSLLMRYPWPGNVRELAAVIERAAILGSGRRLEVAKALGSYDGDTAGRPLADALVSGVRPLPEGVPSLRSTALHSVGPASSVPPPSYSGAIPMNGTAPAELAPLGAAMVSHIERALVATHGRIEGPFGAAKLLGINPHTLRARMRKLGIDWARFRSMKEGAAG
ncbi:MAG TPA: sigma 54-interacting transcriptional regulator [Polyangiales bacterium]|jgi:hydrogenase-4 transcriptional activator|nr:sigma 54-interacting transcriptional regulator [Polyangiales bacterium]